MLKKIWSGFQAVALAICAIYTCGCFPAPVLYHTRPDIEGVIMQNGRPAEGVKVTYSTNLGDTKCDSDDAYPQTAVTSSDGTFHLQGTRSFFHIVYLMPGSEDDGTGRICFDTADGQRLNNRVFIKGGKPVGSIPPASWDQVRISCELNNDTCNATAR